MKALIGLIVVTVAGLVGALLFRLGTFKEVTVSEGNKGPYKIVFKNHVGAYHKIVPVIESVEKWAKENGESCHLSFGEFLDDPDKVEEDRLRSIAGCMVEKTWDFVLPAGFGFRELPSRFYVIAEFEGAPSIGPFKVYPRAKEYIEAHNYKMSGSIMEIYEILSPEKVKTTYLFPVEKAQGEKK
jgi:AraC family transcriptional regulator